jgi:hypothetical protein
MSTDIESPHPDAHHATAGELDAETAEILDGLRALLLDAGRPDSEVLSGLDHAVGALERFRDRLDRVAARPLDLAALPCVLRARADVLEAQDVVAGELASRGDA